MKSTHIVFTLIIVSVAICSLYFTTGARNITAFADSDELITSSYLLGTLHPPGYPVFTFLLWGMIHLLPGDTIVHSAHMAAGVQQTLSLLCITLCSYFLLKACLPTTSPSRQIVISLATMLLLATSKLYWLYANVIEVFPLNHVFIAATLAWSVFIFSKNNVSKRFLTLWTVLLGFSTALMLGHHQLSVLVTPTIGCLLILALYTYAKTIQNTLQLGVMYICIVIVVWGANQALLLTLNQAAPLAWSFPVSLSGVLHHVFRQDYADIVTADGRQTGVYLTIPSLSQNLPGIRYYFTTVFDSFSFIVFFVFALSIFYSIYLIINQKNRLLKPWQYLDDHAFSSQIIILSLLVGFTLSGPLLGFYLALPTQDANPVDVHHLLGVTQRMYLQSLLFLPIIAAFVIARLSYHIKLPYIIIVSGVLISYQVWQFYPQVDLSRYTLVKDVTAQILTSQKPDTVMMCFSDISCFSLLAFQILEKVRTDVVIVPITRQLRTQWLEFNHPHLQRWSFPDNYLRSADIIATALRNFQHVALAQIPNRYLADYGLHGGITTATPYGLTVTASCNTHQLPTTTNLENTSTSANISPLDSLSGLITEQINSTHVHSHEFVLSYTAMMMQQLTVNAVLHAQRGESTQAMQAVSLAETLYPGTHQVQQVKNQILQDKVPIQEHMNNCTDAQQLQQEYQQCLKTNDLACQYLTTFWITLVNPEDLEAQQRLLNWYKQFNRENAAKWQSQVVKQLQ